MSEPEIKVPEPKPKQTLDYTEPIWSGRPPPGARLEVLKDGSIISEIELKSKSYFVFGRAHESVDVLCEHPSISRMHAILQFKENGDAYLYDLGSTHGTLINKRAIPAYEHLKLSHSDLFRLGQSTRLYIYSYDNDANDEETISTASTKQSKEDQALSRKQRMLKLYEEKVKKEVIHQYFIHNSIQEEAKVNQDDKATWGINFENDEFTKNEQIKATNNISEEDIKKYGLQFGQQINYEALKNKPDLSDAQKSAIKKVETTIKRIEKLSKELDGIQSKQAQMLDLTQGQQERFYKIESELEELRDTLEHQEDNVRNMICKFSFLLINFYRQR